MAKSNVLKSFAVASVFAFVFTTGCSSAPEPEASPTVVTVTASPEPVSPREALNTLLNEDAVLREAICSKTAQLASVGWPVSMIPNMLVEFGYLDKFQVKQLEATGLSLKKAVNIAVESCG